MIVLPPECKPDFAKMPNMLVPTIVQCVDTNTVLMLAYMNDIAWEQTLTTGEAHYWSRSRKCLWHKGGTSGHIQKVKRLYLDCDRDTILLHVEQVGGAACHTGHASCFYRELSATGFSVCSPYVFDPEEVYK